MYLPHQLIEQQLQHRFDQTIRQNYFRGMDFAGPAGDPGWFGPGSAVWHVHSHTEALVFGLQCAAFIERLDPSIYWMGMHHSRLVKRDENGDAIPVVDPKGAAVRLGHSIAFFIGTAYGSTRTAEKVAQTVREAGLEPWSAAGTAERQAWVADLADATVTQWLQPGQHARGLQCGESACGQRQVDRATGIEFLAPRIGPAPRSSW